MFRNIRLYKYSLPLTEPLFLKGEKIHRRQGLLIEIENHKKNKGIGEIAPLSGVHRESLEQVQEEILDFITQKKPSSALSCSSAFGLSSAIALLKAKDKNLPLDSLFGLPHAQKVGVNALILTTSKQCEKTIAALLTQGFQSFKIKVGTHSLAQDIQRVQNLHRLIHNKASMRIDANQAYSLPEAIEFCKALGSCCVEYIEEPLINSNEIRYLRTLVQMPIALDETLFDLELKDLGKLPKVNNWIIKPSRIGSLAKNQTFLNFALTHNIKCTLTSCFESGIGLSILSILAGYYLPDQAAGLSTYTSLAADISEPLFKLSQGHISLALCASILEKVSLEKSTFCERIF